MIPIAALVVSIVINLVSFAFFLGFYFGTFKEFKKNTEQALSRLMSVYFTEKQELVREVPAASRKPRARTAGPDVDDEN